MATFKIACHLEGWRGGMRKKEVKGCIVCNGLFGIHNDGGWYTLTQLGTGRRVANFSRQKDAKRCAIALSQLSLPWDMKCLAEWRAVPVATRREIDAMISDLGGH